MCDYLKGLFHFSFLANVEVSHGVGAAYGVVNTDWLNAGATRRFKVSVKNSLDAIDYRADYC